MTLSKQFVEEKHLENPYRSSGNGVKVILIAQDPEDLEWINSEMSHLTDEDTTPVQLHEETLQKVVENKSWLMPKFFINFLPFRQSHRNIRTMTHKFQDNEHIYTFEDSVVPGGPLLRDVFLYFVSQATTTHERVVHYASYRHLFNVTDKGHTANAHHRLKRVLYHLCKINVKIIESGRVVYDGPIFDQPTHHPEEINYIISFDQVFFNKFIMTKQVISISRNRQKSKPSATRDILSTLIRYEQSILSPGKRKTIDLSDLTLFCCNDACSSGAKLRRLRHEVKNMLEDLEMKGVKFLDGSLYLSHTDHDLFEENRKNSFHSFFKSPARTRRRSKRWQRRDSENFLRRELETLTGKKFPSIRPSWLRNPSTGCLLELDCYNSDLGVAFEYQGIQHYTAQDHFGGTDTLEKVKQRDSVKRDLCKQKGINLIEIDGRDYCVNNRDKFKKYIKFLVDKQINI